VPDDLSLTTRPLDGDPARELLRTAREDEFDVIVMGSSCTSIRRRGTRPRGM